MLANGGLPLYSTAAVNTSLWMADDALAALSWLVRRAPMDMSLQNAHARSGLQASRPDSAG